MSIHKVKLELNQLNELNVQGKPASYNPDWDIVLEGSDVFFQYVLQTAQERWNNLHKDEIPSIDELSEMEDELFTARQQMVVAVYDNEDDCDAALDAYDRGLEPWEEWQIIVGGVTYFVKFEFGTED